jgi:triosephosphate isomerase
MSIQSVSDGPLVLVNFKCYLEATGRRAVDLSRRIAEAGRNYGVSVGVAPQFCDIPHVVGVGDVLVFGQHIDTIEPGAFTGKVLAESLKAVGAAGSLLNHSERMIRLDEVQRTVIRARELGLLTVVCAGNTDLAVAVSLMNPDMVAIEPPELIGSGRAVSKEKPEVIESSVRKIRTVNRSIKILCGAGISTGEDVYAALRLGAQGVLVASGVVKSNKPEHVISDFCEAARRSRS